MDKTQNLTQEDASCSTTKAPSSVEAVVTALINDFREGVSVPGQRLAEPDLTRRFGVGRGTIREALKRLVGEGLVTITRFQGAFIRSLTKSEMLDTLLLLEVLYGLAARQAAERLVTTGRSGEFRECLSYLLSFEGTSDFYAAVKAREEFFDLVCEISCNAELGRIQPRLLLSIARIQVRQMMDDSVRYRDYKMIGDAILDQDPKLAEFSARRHLQHAVENFEKIPESLFRSEEPELG